MLTGCTGTSAFTTSRISQKRTLNHTHVWQVFSKVSLSVLLMPKRLVDPSFDLQKQIKRERERESEREVQCIIELWG